MKGISFLTALVLSPLALAASLAAAAPSADQALKILQEGNARFAAGNLQHPNQSSVRRTEVLAGQTPFVTVLTCSDSRVPVETLFDQGVGDVFVVRVAGNVAKTDEIGSIEYGAGHLGTPLLLVLGHTKCGAVKAVAEGAEVGGSIPELVAPIAPVVERVRAENPNLASDALIAKAVTANVWNSIENIFQTSSEIRELVKEGKLTVVGGVYDLATGAVEVLGSHPQQARLLAAGEESGTQEHAAVSTTPEPSAATAATAPAGAAPELSTSVGIGGLAVGGAVLALVLWGAWSFSRTGMKNWTVGRRIGVGFATVLLVLSGLAAVSYVNFHTSFDSFTEYRAIARHSNLAGRIQANFLKMRIVVKDFQVTRNRSEIQTFDQRKVMVFKFVEEGKAALADSSERLKFITEVESELTKYVAGFAEMSKSGTSTTRINQLAKGMAANGETIDRQIENLKLSLISEQDHIGPSLQAQMQYIQSLMLWIGLAAIVLGAVFAFIIDRSIVLPLRALSNSIRDCADQTSSAAGQVSSSSQTLAEGASEQAASIEETSASIEEISSMTKHNAESATQAKDLSNQTRAAADTGASDMEQMKSAMDAIKASSGEIAKIVKTIDEIAFQTNILALNAAVEAARAGEAGAGFAVVAEEVRNLAQRSAQSAKETASKIEESISRSEHGVNISAKVADSLQLIVERARSMDNLVAEIAKASTEQSQGLGQVNTAISQMDKVTQSNAGNAEETASAAEELSSQAVSMHEMTEELLRLVGTSQGHTTARMPAAAMAVTKTEPKQTAAKQARVSRRQQKQSVATQANGKGDHDDFFADA